MKANRKVNLLHAIRDGQGHVSPSFEESFPAKNTGAAGEVGGPLRAPFVETNRFTRVIERGADD